MEPTADPFLDDLVAEWHRACRLLGAALRVWAACPGPAQGAAVLAAVEVARRPLSRATSVGVGFRGDERAARSFTRFCERPHRAALAAAERARRRGDLARWGDAVARSLASLGRTMAALPGD